MWSARNKIRNRKSRCVRNCRNGTLGRETWASLRVEKQCYVLKVINQRNVIVRFSMRLSQQIFWESSWEFCCCLFGFATPRMTLENGQDNCKAGQVNRFAKLV